MRQVWSGVSNDFLISWFQEARGCDCKSLPEALSAEIALVGEGNESTMAGWLEACLFSLGYRGPVGHCLDKVSTAVIDSDHVTDAYSTQLSRQP